MPILRHTAASLVALTAACGIAPTQAGAEGGGAFQRLGEISGGRPVVAWPPLSLSLGGAMPPTGARQLGGNERPPLGDSEDKAAGPPTGSRGSSIGVAGGFRDSAAARAAELEKALAPKPPPEALRKQMLDVLFGRLRDAPRQEDAVRIAASIERLWRQSSSDTANLLMERATASLQTGQFPLALSLLDKLVILEPNWAESWNQRAAARFMTGDSDGAMADINRALKIEPRHFGALAGMGVILQKEGLDRSALTVFKKALAIYPLAPDIRKLVENLARDVEGQDI